MIGKFMQKSNGLVSLIKKIGRSHGSPTKKCRKRGIKTTPLPNLAKFHDPFFIHVPTLPEMRKELPEMRKEPLKAVKPQELGFVPSRPEGNGYLARLWDNLHGDCAGESALKTDLKERLHDGSNMRSLLNQVKVHTVAMV